MTFSRHGLAGYHDAALCTQTTSFGWSMESTRDKASGSRGSDFRLKCRKQPDF